MHDLTAEKRYTHLAIDWERVPKDSKLEGFLVFHENHPDVFERFLHYSRELRDRGLIRGNSSRRVIDRIRWDGWYVWEHYSPYYARLLDHAYRHEFGADFFANKAGPADQVHDVVMGDCRTRYGGNPAWSRP